MANVKYGLTSWDEVELKNNNNFQRQKDQYMRLENGNNIMRIITRPHQYLVHNFKEEGDTGFGDKIMCSSFHGSCPICEKGGPENKAKRRWLVGIIDRKTQVYKILDMSFTVFKAIQELSRDEDYGDPSKYDIDVKVDKQGGATGYYTVIPKPPKALSAADVETKSKIQPEELVRKCTPPTAEQVQQRIDAVRARKNGGNVKPAESTKVTKSAAPVVSQNVDQDGSDDSDYTFPVANV